MHIFFLSRFAGDNLQKKTCSCSNKTSLTRTTDNKKSNLSKTLEFTLANTQSTQIFEVLKYYCHLNGSFLRKLKINCY